jgi:hypothetical protein
MNLANRGLLPVWTDVVPTVEACLQFRCGMHVSESNRR